MTKLPHSKYLTALIVGKMNNQEIFTELKKVSLPVPPLSELDNLRNEVIESNKSYFRTPKNKLDPELE